MTEEFMDETVAVEGAEGRQFVVFKVGKEIFAVDLKPVHEIIRVPHAVEVPLAPDSLTGLINLRGSILPIVSLRHILGFEQKQNDEYTRALVLSAGQLQGFIVDRVVSVISVEPDRIEPVDGVNSSIDGDLVSGIIRDIDAYPLVMMLDFNRIVEKEFAGLTATGDNEGFTEIQSVEKEVDEKSRDIMQLVSFSVENQEYGIDIYNVLEIVEIPEIIVHVPNVPEHVVGMMTLRERFLPLISLRSLFCLSERSPDDRSHIVVVNVGHTVVGIITDGVSEVLRIPLDLIDPLPEILSHENKMNDISQICRIDNGARLVSVISAERLLHNSSVKEVLETVKEMNKEKEGALYEETSKHQEEQFVIFKLEEVEFGVPIASVQEIVRIPENLTSVPKAPEFIEGVINLRGTVLPVIDQRKRLGLSIVERSEYQRIMIFMVGGVKTGFIVDSVTEVLKISGSDIEKAPRLSDEQSQLLGRVANLDKQKRLIQLIDPEYLIEEQDRSLLKNLDKDSESIRI